MSRRDAYSRRDRAWQPTDRQREVLDLLLEGKSNAEIAVRLDISVDGAKWHVSELLSQTGCADRQALAAWWRRERGGDSARKTRGFVLLSLRRLLPTAAALLAGVVVLVAAVALTSGNHVGGPSAEIQHLSEKDRLEALSVHPRAANALELARKTAPDVRLAQVVVNPVSGTSVFSFISLGSFEQIDVLIPKPGSAVGDWLVERGDPTIDPSLLRSQLDLSRMDVDVYLAATTVTDELGCIPVSLSLVPFGVRQSWFVSCDFSDGRRVLGLVDAESGRLDVPGAPVDPSTVRALTGGPPPAGGRTVRPLDTAPEWSTAQFVKRDGSILSVRLASSDIEVLIDLAAVGVFDCRLECYVNIGERLGGLGPEEEICISGWRTEGAIRTVWSG